MNGYDLNRQRIELEKKKGKQFPFITYETMSAILLLCSPVALAVYMELIRYNNTDTGLCCPSQSLLAEKVNVSKKTVIKALTQLEEHGFIASQFCTNKLTKKQYKQYFFLDKNIEDLLPIEPAQDVTEQERQDAIREVVMQQIAELDERQQNELQYRVMVDIAKEIRGEEREPVEIPNKRIINLGKYRRMK